MMRFHLAAASLALALVSACGPKDSAETTSPELATGHAEIEWASWEPETFERARNDDRILLINVVASWCHWCHVMEEETYEDPEVAALIDEHFVAIRIDSDARPDIAERYREWGWPATAFLTPDAQPVLALRGYKNPKKFEALLRELIADRDAGTLSQRVLVPDPPEARPSELAPLLAEVTAQLDDYFDPDQGGWGRRQKYPFAAPAEHALMRARLYGESQWAERAQLTLANERQLIDPVWGGIYQYSLRGDWEHPHYEKITAIQAGAIENFAQLARATNDDQWIAPARQVSDYMQRFMRDPEGGFRTSQDADLRREGQPAVVGEDYYARGEEQRLALGLPRIDENVYADLNGLMIRAMVELYAATGDPADLDAAVGAAEHLMRTHRTSDGAFMHGADDDPEGLLHLRDQASMGAGLLALYRATGQSRWLAAATEVGVFMRAKLEDSDQGGFWAHTADPAAVGVFAQRRKPVEENGLAARFLVDLHRYLDGDGTGDTPYAASAERALAAVAQANVMKEEGRVVGRFLLALESVTMPTVDVTVVGAPDDPRTEALALAALHLPEPRAVVERSLPGERYPDTGSPAVYLCTETACSSPITDASALRNRAEQFLAESLPPRPR